MAKVRFDFCEPSIANLVSSCGSCSGFNSSVVMEVVAGIMNYIPLFLKVKPCALSVFAVKVR